LDGLLHIYVEHHRPSAEVYYKKNKPENLQAKEAYSWGRLGQPVVVIDVLAPDCEEKPFFQIFALVLKVLLLLLDS